MIYVDVILPLPLQNTFTYEVPSEFEAVEEGMRVVVQFGQKKFYTAVVYLSTYHECKNQPSFIFMRFYLRVSLNSQQ